jgi:multiple sugar transport system substrate-binding protein
MGYRPLSQRVFALIASVVLTAGCVMQPTAPAATSAPAKPASATTAPATTAAAVQAAVPAPALPTAPVELVFWATSLPSKVDYFKDMIESYQKLHPNVTIQADFVSFTDLPKKLLVTLGTGTGPDVFETNTGWLAPFLEKNQLEPLSPPSLGYASLDTMKQAYVPGTLDPLIRDGKLFVLPYDMKSLSLYINTEHFRAAGLDPEKDYPKTWDETLAVAKKLTKVENGKITRQGYRWVFVNATWSQNHFEPLIHQFGGDTLTPDGKCALNSPAGIKAMQVMASFVREGVMDPSVSVGTAALPTTDFVKEVSSMIVALPTVFDEIKGGNPGMIERNAYKVVPLPQVDPNKPVTLLQANTLAVNAATTADKKIVAQDFARHLASRPTEILGRVSMAIQPLQSVRNSPELAAIPFSDVFLTDISRGQLQTQSRFSPDIVSALHRAVETVLLSNGDPKESLDRACDEVNRAIGS